MAQRSTAQGRPIRLSEMTWPEVADAAARGAIVAVPTGATEQHGPHLPLATDHLIPDRMAQDMAGELDLVIAPAIVYGNRSRPLAGGGEGFPGTLSLRATSFMAHLEDVLVALARSGFRKIAILNWHFENANFVYEAAYVARERAGCPDLRIMVVEATFAGVSDHVVQALFGDEFPGWDVEHAAVLETSMMLHLFPHLVHMERAVDDEALRHPAYDVVPPPADFVPASGTLWKATRASEDKGRIVWGDIIPRLTAAISSELGVDRPAAPGY